MSEPMTFHHGALDPAALDPAALDPAAFEPAARDEPQLELAPEPHPSTPRRGRIAALDSAVLIYLGRIDSRLLTRMMRALTRLGNAESWLLVGLVLALSGGHGPRLALLLGSGALFATLSSQLLKRLVCRPRPSASGLVGFRPRVEVPDEFSFPSGHTSAAFGVVAALAGEAGPLVLLMLALAVGIALSRIYLGAHYPLDVAAGVLLGTGSGWAAQGVLAGMWAPGTEGVMLAPSLALPLLPILGTSSAGLEVVGSVLVVLPAL